MVENKTK